MTVKMKTKGEGDVFRHTLICGALAFMVIVHVSPASHAEKLNEAISCFKEGNSLFKQKQYKLASMKFREAYELKPSWKLFFNIGQSEAAAKRHGLALEAFERFLSEGGDDIVVTRRDQVFGEVERLRKIVGFLRVRAPEGTVVMVDGVRRGRSPVSMLLPVAVGYEHEVIGELDGQRLPPKRFRVIGGQTMTVDLDERPAEESTVVEIVDKRATPEPLQEETFEQVIVPDEPDQDAFPYALIGWIVSGVGAGSAVAGAILGGIALSKNKSLVDACKDSPCPEKRDEKEQRDKLATSATVLLAVGGTAIAAGATLLIVGKTKEADESLPVTVSPGLDGKSIAASFGWRF